MTIFAPPELTPPQLRAVQALLVFEDASMPYGSTRHALTTHAIEQTPSGVELGAGRLLGLSDQQALLDILLGALAAEGGYLPAEVLAHSGAQLAWLVPGRVRPMWFRVAREARVLQVPWPHLLLRAQRNGFALAALKRAVRPSADTPLYHAPLMNVHAHTGLCTGNAPLPQGWSLSHRPQYEAVVFETAFSHVNHDHTLLLAGSRIVSTAQHYRFWQALDKQHATRFPTRALAPLKRTVAQWLKAP